MRRVVVTGLGLVTPLSVGVKCTWEKLISGKSGLSSLKGLNGGVFDKLPSTVAGIVPRGDDSWQFNDKMFEGQSERTMAPFIQYAILAAEEALLDSGWKPALVDELERTGVAVGSGIGGIEEIAIASSYLCENKYRKISPYFVPKLLVNMAAGHISIRHGFRGPNHSVSTACATGANAIGDAARFIQHGDADVMVAGGSESTINEISISGFCRAQALSSKYNSTPEKASRPFDRDRDGFVIGEGAGIVILEELEHAQRRNAHIYAEITGYGLSGDAYHITAPSPDARGAYLAMMRALNDARLKPVDVDYVNAHATSTPLGDAVENKAIRQLFFQNKDVLISSTKGAIGHLLGAAGAVEAIFTVLALKHQVAPPTLNLENFDDSSEFDMNYVPINAQKRAIRSALTNSFGFGGTNVSLCFSRDPQKCK